MLCDDVNDDDDDDDDDEGDSGHLAIKENELKGKLRKRPLWPS